jgi:hypothetical protein
MPSASPICDHLGELVEGAVGSGGVLVVARCRVDVDGVLPGPPGAVGVPDVQESSDVCTVGIHASRRPTERSGAA